MVAERCQTIPEPRASQKSLRSCEAGRVTQHGAATPPLKHRANVAGDKWRRTAKDDRRNREDNRPVQEARQLAEFSHMIDMYKRG